MKIAYIGQMADVSHENGISKKIRAQILAWQEHGHEVRYFSLARSAQVWSGFAPVDAHLVRRGPPPLRFLRSHRLAAEVRAWRPDVIYFRYAYHSPGFPALFREVPTVAELNSDDRTEYPLTLPPLAVAYHRLTRKRVLRPIAGFVAVTRELGTRFAPFAKPAVVIGNGIDLARFTPAPPTTPDAPLRLFFAGTESAPWHGLDRLAELAELFPGLRVDIIGSSPEQWEAAIGRRSPVNVTAHGVLSRSRYEPLLAAATAAIGTLALFRKRMNEACPLKVREYLAFGLPVIAAYDDTDIPPGADYYLRLPNEAAPLAAHRATVATWLEAWRGRRVPRSAVGHLDTAVKEKQRLEFIARIVRETRR